jgi:hypothetical protein
VFPRDMVCLRNISVDTLHKGDIDDTTITTTIIIIIIIIIIIKRAILGTSHIIRKVLQCEA